MWEWDNSDIVKVLNEGKSLTELANVNQIAKSADRRCQLILLELAIENALQIVDIEATSAHEVLIYFEFYITITIRTTYLHLICNIVT